MKTLLAGVVAVFLIVSAIVLRENDQKPVNEHVIHSRPEAGSNPIDVIVLSQKWIGWSKGTPIKHNGEVRLLADDLAYLELSVRIVNPSPRAIMATSFFCLRDEKGFTIARFSIVSIEGISEAEKMKGCHVFLKQHGQRTLNMTSVAQDDERIRSNQPLYIHAMDNDPEGRKTIPEANNTVLKWQAPPMPKALDLYTK